MQDVCGGIGGARLTGIPIGTGQGEIGSALKGTIGTNYVENGIRLHCVFVVNLVVFVGFHIDVKFFCGIH